MIQKGLQGEIDKPKTQLNSERSANESRDSLLVGDQMFAKPSDIDQSRVCLQNPLISINQKYVCKTL